jgi:hypothetical protein
MCPPGFKGAKRRSSFPITSYLVAGLYDAGLVAQAKIGDDKLGRALDRLFATDRATLQTRIVLAVMKRCLSLATWFCSVDGSPTLPSNTSIATGQP